MFNNTTILIVQTILVHLNMLQQWLILFWKNLDKARGKYNTPTGGY